MTGGPRLRAGAALLVALLVTVASGCSDAHTEEAKRWSDEGIDPRLTTLVVPQALATSAEDLVDAFTAQNPTHRLLLVVRDPEVTGEEVTDTEVPTVWLDTVHHLDVAGPGRATQALGVTPLVQIYARATGIAPPLDLYAGPGGGGGLCADDDPCGFAGRQALANNGLEPAEDVVVASPEDLVFAVADGNVTTALVNGIAPQQAWLRVAWAPVPAADDLSEPVEARAYGPEGDTGLFMDWLAGPEADALLSTMGIEPSSSETAR